MKRIYLLTIPMVTLAVPALSQTAQPVDETVQALSSDWGSQATATKHILDGINKLVAEKQALKAENDKLKKELEEANAKLPKPEGAK